MKVALSRQELQELKRLINDLLMGNPVSDGQLVRARALLDDQLRLALLEEG